MNSEMSLDWLNLATIFNESTWHELDLDVNLGNRHIINGMMYSGIGLAMNNDYSGTYGFPIKLEDGGHCFEVMCNENGRWSAATSAALSAALPFTLVFCFGASSATTAVGAFTLVGHNRCDNRCDILFLHSAEGIRGSGLCGCLS